MKELSIEEKTKRYDEALERAKKLQETCDSTAVVGWCEYIFPELKESEDEEIRKWLINEIKIKHHNLDEENIEFVDKAIAWLEKQGESDETKAKIFLINNGYPIDSNGKFPTYEEMYYIIKDGIEKQGEQNPTNEPKFKVGDWVVFNNKHQSIYQVEKIEDGYYILRHTHGGTFRVCMLHDESLRLWTIQDAKDGDVLIDKSNGKECPFIFKETKPSNIKTDVLNPLSVLGYCGIGGAGFTKGSGWGDTANCIYYPATKEQRDTLMKAMADAGYEWDAEKKELKKAGSKIFNG